MLAAEGSLFVVAATIARRSIRTVLLDCEGGERERCREEGREQPELATTEMAAWAAYLGITNAALALDDHRHS